MKNRIAVPWVKVSEKYTDNLDGTFTLETEFVEPFWAKESPCPHPVELWRPDLFSDGMICGVCGKAIRK